MRTKNAARLSKVIADSSRGAVDDGDLAAELRKITARDLSITGMILAPVSILLLLVVLVLMLGRSLNCKPN
jgi:hypothetical protein